MNNIIFKSLILVFTLGTSAASEKHHTDLSHTVSKLDIDGEYFSIKKITDDGDQILRLTDIFLRYAQSSGESPLLSFEQMVKGIGITEINSFGQSSKKQPYGWVNKTYIGHNHYGLIQTFTKNQSPWKVADLAPKNSTAAFELNINAKEAMPFFKACMQSLVYNENDKDIPKQLLATPAAPQLTVQQLIESTNLRVSGMFKLEPKETISNPTFGFQGLSFALHIEGINEKLLDDLPSQLGKNFIVEEDAKHVFIKQAKPSTTIFSNTAKQLVIQRASKTSLWICSSSSYFFEIVNSKQKLAQTDHYKKTIQRSQQQGSTLVYISPSLAQSIHTNIDTFVGLLNNSEQMKPLVKTCKDLSKETKLFFDNSNGYCLTISNDKHGSYIHEISPISNKYMSLPSVAFIASFYGFYDVMKPDIK